LTGIDFYFPRQQEARKMVDFVTAVLPAKFQHSQVSIFQNLFVKILLNIR